MTWIKFEATTHDKVEVWEMAQVLQIDPDAVVGKLLKIWLWFDSQTENGHAASVTKMLLDSRVSVTGFCDAMIKVGWMHEEDSMIYLPNFERHNGQTAKNRALAALRKQKSRFGHDTSVTSVGQNCDQRREEKRRKEKTTASVPSEQTYSDDFQSFWDAYPPIRRTQKKKAFSLFQKAIKHVSAETVIASAKEYAQSDVGSSEYAVGATVFLGNHMWEDDRQAWSRGKPALTTGGSAERPKLMPDPERLMLEDLFTRASRTSIPKAIEMMTSGNTNGDSLRGRINAGLAAIKKMDRATAIELVPAFGKYLEKEMAK